MSVRKVFVSQSAIDGLQSYAKDYATQWVRWCGEKYDFDADLALKDLAKLDISTEVAATIQPDTKQSKTGKKKTIPIPFNPNKVSQESCQALVFNDGLFTQCDGAKDNESFCTKCLSGELVEGVPVCGTIQQRLSTSLMSYQDLKGRKVKHYTEVLKKRKFSIEEATAYFEENNFMEITEEHLVVPAKVERRGRPKKEKKEIVSVSPVSDIFEELAKSATDSVADNDSVSEVSVVTPSVTNESPEEKKAKKEAVEAEKKAKKEAAEAEKKAKKEAAEAAKKAAEDEKKAKKEAAEAEKLAKKEAAEAEKKANKEQKNLFEALKKAEKEAKKAEKEAKKAEKEAKKAEKESKKAEKVAEPVVEPVVEPVKRIEINGKKYLKTHDNVLYDEATQEAVGELDPETNEVVYYEEEEEIEEEDYEE